MKRMFGFVGIIVGTQFIVSSAIAGTTYVSGVISTNTVWDATGSPYIVTGDVLIDSAVTLDIEPGVEVRIDSVKHIMIKGTLNAIGTATDSIIISARDTTKRWERLWFKPASAGSLKYCRIEYAGGSAIYDSTGSLTPALLVIKYNMISNNFASNHGGGIYTRGSSTIANNIITNNSANEGGGIWSYGSSTIANNIITNNSASLGGGGIQSEWSLIISNNTIIGNSASLGGGICSCWSPPITNNAIIGNSADYGGGIYHYGTSPIISNNIIRGNSASHWGGGIYHWSGSPIISNNIIRNNSAARGGSIWTGSRLPTIGSPKIKYNSIIDTTTSAIYIHSDSALIDSNNLYATGYAIWNNDTFDIDARYNYWGTVSNDTIDMKIWDFYDASTKGIVYYEPFLTKPLEFGIEERKKLRVESLELRVFPNPSTTGVRVQWSGVSEGQEISLKVYDLGGRLVKTVLTTKQGVEINLEELSKGIYFVRVETHTGLVTGDFKATKKIILMR
ncbi:T9SS type A sorting domain-containing protein [candidate division WOR-3 bacterium]|nr:T9SS type A sorting domain-containing protein [candidate division WOR-3 bacterium]